MKRLGPGLIFAAVVVAALIWTSGDEPMRPGDRRPEPAAPALSVTRLDGDGTFDLAQLSSAQTPTLLWFWAPWCEVCNAEAPAIQRLAETGRDELTVVAIGGRDDLANAPGFVARHRLRTPTLLFDESMAVWRAYRIPGQPGAVLLDRNGRERARWLGPFDTDLALEAARTL